MSALHIFRTDRDDEPPALQFGSQDDSLPRFLTTLVGREALIAEIGTLLSSGARMVVLTGPGGIGKTRLSIEAARVARAGFRDGARFVGLASVETPDGVLPAIGEALGIRQVDRSSPEADLVEALRQQNVLLVLDNLEQVASVAPALGRIVAACPQLALLVTSRVSLRVRGAREIPVTPLAVPPDADRHRTASPAGATEPSGFPAVTLFLQRASEAGADLTAGPEIDAICRRLEGLPLAIELAASWSRVLSPGDLLDQLDHQLDVLTGGGEDLPERQQTILGTLVWSYRLLDPGHQRLLRRVAVFARGFTRDAAVAICGADLGGLAALIDHSFLRRVESPDDGGSRFVMLAVVREFALCLLREDGDDYGRVSEAHAAWFLEWVTAGEREHPQEETAWFAQLDREHANILAAAGWLSEAGRYDDLLRLATAMGRFWRLRGHLREGSRWLELALTRASEPAATASPAPYHWLGTMWVGFGDYRVARSWLERGLEVARATGDGFGEARALFSLGGVSEYEGDDDQAVGWYRRSLARAEAIGDDVWIGRMHDNLSDAAFRQGHLDAAADHAERAIASLRQARPPTILSSVLISRAQVACVRGDLASAVDDLRESLGLCRTTRYYHGLADVMVGFAAVAAALGMSPEASRLLGASASILERAQFTIVAHAELFRQTETRLREAPGEASLGDERMTGARLDADEILALCGEIETAARERGAVTPRSVTGNAREGKLPDAAVAAGLTQRELEVLRLLAEGRSDREIAAALFISHRTVMGHVGHILAKLDVPSRTAAAVAAGRLGLL